MRKLFIVCIILVGVCSCTDDSAKSLSNVPAEKVVVIDSALGSVSDNYIRYKVKRVDKGVVTFITLMKGLGGRFEKGDTIYFKFQ